MDLNTIWFLLICVLLTGYAILDGFDLGAGVAHLFARSESERRTFINAIAPVWDGNEVWLLTGGGALFAAFPAVYATVFSGFYLALMFLLVALIVRAVSMEFRGKVDNPRWKKWWDWGFGLGSLLPAFLLGVAYGNILHGIPLARTGDYTGSFFDLLNPFALLVGVFSLTLFAMHGALYLSMKVEGELRAKMVSRATRLWMASVVLFIIVTGGALLTAQFLFQDILLNPVFWVLMILLLVSSLSLPVFLKGGRLVPGFIASSLTIACLMGISALSLYPRLVPSSIDISDSLTIYNASSSPTTLTVMLVIAGVGVPIVIAYTVFIYRIFKGKVVLGPDSY
jgi:cytochrome d ubiquinol oxidase subunit II